MDKIIDFNELKNRVNDKDVDQFESYIYSLYYKMAEGKINMSEFSKELGEYMEKNNLSPDKFLKMQTKLMERYGIDASGFEEQPEEIKNNENAYMSQETLDKCEEYKYLDGDNLRLYEDVWMKIKG